jgi:hypothetical protein
MQEFMKDMKMSKRMKCFLALLEVSWRMTVMKDMLLLFNHQDPYPQSPLNPLVARVLESKLLLEPSSLPLEEPSSGKTFKLCLLIDDAISGKQVMCSGGFTAVS